LTELEEVVLELSALDVHDVELDTSEGLDGSVEFVENAGDRLGHGLTLGVSDLNLLELVELHDGAGQVHDVLASLAEGVEADEESVGGDLPLVLALGLVVEVGFLEASADLDAGGEALVGFTRVLS
jgi:hypothetical protein